jgi:hypothetical protein
MVPLFFLNFLGAVVSGIWLALLGEWGGIGMGLLASILGTFFCGSLLLPGFLVSVPAIFMMDKGGILKALGFIIGMVGLLWTFIVMSGWGMFSFGYFMARADSDSSIPYLIWAYGIATGPWASMAKDDNNEFSIFSVFFLQIAAATSIITIGFTNMSVMATFLTFAGIMLLGYIFNIVMGGVLTLLEVRESSAV